MTDAGLAIGLMAESPQQLHALGRIVREAGHHVVGALDATRRIPEALPDASAWLVRLDTHYDEALEILEMLDARAVPVIYDDTDFGDALADFAERSRRIAGKLRQLAGRQEPARVGKRAREVWVIAASAGGPGAVTDFLRALDKIPDEVALLYVQHIGSETSATLKRVIDNSSRWNVCSTDEFCVLEENTLYIVSPRSALELTGDGSIQPSGQPWQGPYSPSIDQVMAKVARRYGARSGAIIFSGMGDDGQHSCAFMKRLGGQIWAQEPATCAIDSMPQCAIDSSCVNFIGSPEALALKFTQERLLPIAEPKVSSDNLAVVDDQPQDNSSTQANSLSPDNSL
jgi:chemosensory pili system protein ChpB (putative protein-glutamate methylesterase)